MQRANSFASRLRRRETVVGTVLTLPCAPLAELASEPADFVWVDLEHGALGVADVQPLAIAARAAAAAALVRLPDRDAARLGAILDAGVDGVVAPRVESADEARRLVERLRYPPLGSRGFATRRSTGYGRRGPSDAPPPRPTPSRPSGPADAELVVIAQIESAAGVEASVEIAVVDGVDALVVGCADLSLALTGSLEPRSPHTRQAIAHVQRAAAAAGIASGIAGPGDADLLFELAGDRSTVLVHSADVRIYAKAVDDALGAVRLAVARSASQHTEEAGVRP